MAVGLLPSTALANSVTPLVFATLVHLVVGNVLIGLGEGLLLAWCFRLCWWRASVVMVLANYCSAWAGGWLVLEVATHVDLHVANLRAWFAGFAGLAFVVTLLLEAPFVWGLLRRGPAVARRTVQALLLANTLSYAVLGVYYANASELSLLTGFEVVPPAELAPRGAFDVYYLDPGRVGSRPRFPDSWPTELRRANLAGEAAGVVLASPVVRPGVELFMRQGLASHGELLLRRWPLHGEPFDEVLVPELEVPSASPEVTDPPDASNPQPMTPGSEWEFRLGIKDLRVDHRPSATWFELGLEIPFVTWPVRSVVHLEADLALIWLGDDQICLLQARTRRIALFARGWCPAVVKVPSRK